MLLEDVVEAGTLTTFKRHLDGYMNREGIERYGPSKEEGFILVQLGHHDQHRFGGLKGLFFCAALFFVLYVAQQQIGLSRCFLG